MSCCREHLCTLHGVFANILYRAKFFLGGGGQIGGFEHFTETILQVTDRTHYNCSSAKKNFACLISAVRSQVLKTTKSIFLERVALYSTCTQIKKLVLLLISAVGQKSLSTLGVKNFL